MNDGNLDTSPSMTTVPSRTPFQPTLKAPSTAQSSQLSALAGQTPAPSRTSSQVRPKKHVRQEPPNTDFLSDKATVALIQRVLVAESHADSRATPQPLEALLPPLTSSNEVDTQLYAIIAIVIKDFVNTWYSRITPDRFFVDEVIHIIAHCTRALEQRLRQTDIIELILNEVPAVVQRHVLGYRAAHASQAFLSYGESPRQLYHTLNPHPALDPNQSPEHQQLAAVAYRQLLVQGTLASLLPTEDLQNSCLRILVTDIIADLILGRAIDDRLCKGWFLHDLVSKVVATITSRSQPKVTGAEMQADARSHLEKFGLLSAKSNVDERNSSKRHQSLFARWFWGTLQSLYLAIAALRFIFVGMLHARRHSARARLTSAPKSPISDQSRPEPVTLGGNDLMSHFVLNYKVFSAVSTLLNLASRMPWLAGSLIFWQHIFTTGTTRLGPSGSTLDKFLYNTLSQHVFVPSLVPLTLRNTRAVIFPDNSLGPPAPPPPSPEEQLHIRRKAAQDLLSLAPDFVKRTFFATRDDEQMLKMVEGELLDCFGDENMNKHLIYGILEVIIVTLVPELAEKTVRELLAERGVNTELDKDVGTGEYKSEKVDSDEQ